MSAKYTTRFAKWGEREKIAHLYIENLWQIAHFPPDVETVFKSIFHAVFEGRVIVCECGDKIVGCTSFVEGTYWYTPAKMLFDTGLFVCADYRKTRAGFTLLNALRDEAKARAAHLVMGAGTKDKSVAPMMAKRYAQIGAAFVVN